MRSTRATAAIARLNERSPGRKYLMVILGNGLFELRERVDGVDHALGTPLPLDEFVTFVKATGPQIAPRVTKSDAAFAKQLIKKEKI
ncbi:MAG: hypothetical protein D3M94_13585 [Rhodocyclales bacterium GT-UBC]|nr:MAG: hypothetical protein D3M94_13585 [Rhodocyclales bacterium GT-UBC]